MLKRAPAGAGRPLAQLTELADYVAAVSKGRPVTLLCPYCFADLGLRRRLVEVRPQHDEGACDHHPSRKGIPIEAVAEIVDEVFRANFTFGGVDDVPYDPDEPAGYGRQLGQDLTQTIWDLTQPEDDEIANALVAQLIEDDFYQPQRGEEAFYDDVDMRYERITDDDGGHGALWNRFCHTVTHEQRFMNAEVSELLGEIFRHIHLQADTARNHPVYVLRAAENRRLFRARIAGPEDRGKIQENPAAGLGPPPRRLDKPNRMNPSGIAAFYAAFDLDTCVSELRPLVGAEVVFAQFELVRDVVVLDTTRFAAPPKELNLFARDHVRRLGQWRFMQRFMAEIAKPISPGDEHLDYVPTQVVAEFLNRIHEVRIGKQVRPIEGILYRSAQHPEGVNIVMLGDAAVVKDAEPPRPPNLLASFRLAPWERTELRDPTLAYVESTLATFTVSSAAFGREHEMPLWRTQPPPVPRSIFPSEEF